MTIPSRPTLRTVAREAGVSASTASAVLRGAAIVKPSTVEKVLEAARRLGYQRNTAASVMASRKGGGHAHLLSIAVVTHMDSREARPYQWLAVDRIVRHALDRGFLCQHVNLPGVEEASDASRRLVAQGIDGIIFFRWEPVHQAPVLKFDWNSFCVVTHQPEFRSLGIDVVRPSLLLSVTSLLREAASQVDGGMGIVLHHHEPVNQDDRARFAAAAAFQKLDIPRGEPKIPILWKPIEKGLEQAAKNLRKWMKRHEPSLVVGFNPLVGEALDRIGYRVPEDCRLLLMNRPLTDPKYAGLLAEHDAAPAHLVEMLERKIRENIRGLSRSPIDTIYPLPFMPGSSFPDFRVEDSALENFSLPPGTLDSRQSDSDVAPSLRSTPQSAVRDS